MMTRVYVGFRAILSLTPRTGWRVRIFGAAFRLNTAPGTVTDKEVVILVFGNMTLSDAVEVLKRKKELAEVSLKLHPSDTSLVDFVNAVDTVCNYIDKSVTVLSGFSR